MINEYMKVLHEPFFVLRHGIRVVMEKHIMCPLQRTEHKRVHGVFDQILR